MSIESNQYKLRFSEGKSCYKMVVPSVSKIAKNFLWFLYLPVLKTCAQYTGILPFAKTNQNENISGSHILISANNVYV